MLSEKNFTEKNLILGRPRCRKNGLVYVLNFVRKKKNFCSKKIPISSEQNQIFLRTKFWPEENSNFFRTKSDFPSDKILARPKYAR